MRLPPLLVAPRAFFSSLFSLCLHQIETCFLRLHHVLTDFYLLPSFAFFLLHFCMCSVSSSFTSSFCCFLLIFQLMRFSILCLPHEVFLLFPPFCLKFSCYLSFPFCVSLLFSCILFRVFHFFFFILISSGTHEFLFHACLLCLTRNVRVWNVHYKIMY